jgi:Tfp pilus assembly protein PilZ
MGTKTFANGGSVSWPMGSELGELYSIESYPNSRFVWVTGKAKISTKYHIYFEKCDTSTNSSTNCSTIWSSSSLQTDEGLVIKIATGSPNIAYIAGNTYTSSNCDFRVLKYNADNCTFIATNNYIGVGDDILRSMTIDENQNVYVTGKSYLSGSVDDYLTIKYNNALVQQWTIRYQGPSGTDDPQAIVTDNSGNVYVTGISYGGTSNSNDIATVKYNSAGQQQWVTRYNGTSNTNDVGYDITTDNTSLYLTGYINNNQAVIIKYDCATGTQQWIQTNNHSQGQKIKLDNSGNIYVGGGPPIYLIKYDNTGNLQWNKSFETPYYSGYFNNMSVNGSGNFALVGYENVGRDPNYVNNYDQLSVFYESDGSFPASLAFRPTSPIEEIVNPDQYKVMENYPNPFNPNTIIKFSLKDPGLISLKIYNLLGSEVKTLIDNEYRANGEHQINFNASGLPSGTYFYRLSSRDGRFLGNKKMLYLK